jgi:hypothetical protein
LQVLEGLSLSVQQPLDALDDVVAMGQEELEKLDVGLERLAIHGSRDDIATVAVVAFDDGASLAGNESNDSCVTTSARGGSDLARAERLAAAQPTTVPLMSHHTPGSTRRRVTPYAPSTRPAIDARVKAIRLSDMWDQYPRDCQASASDRCCVRFVKGTDSMIASRAAAIPLVVLPESRKHPFDSVDGFIEGEAERRVANAAECLDAFRSQAAHRRP